MADYNQIIQRLEELRDKYINELKGNGDAAPIAVLGGVPTPVDVDVLESIRGEVSTILSQNLVPGTQFVVPELDAVVYNFEEAIMQLWYLTLPDGVTRNPDTNYKAIQTEISDMNQLLLGVYPLSDEDDEDYIDDDDDDALSQKEQREVHIRQNAAAAAAAAAAAEEEDVESDRKKRKTKGGKKITNLRNTKKNRKRKSKRKSKRSKTLKKRRLKCKKGVKMFS